TPAQLKAALAQTLPAYMLPARLQILPTFPLTSNGKVDRAALAALQDTGAEAPPEAVQPRTPIEHAIAALFAACFDTEATPPSIHDNFFELGGTSMMAIQLLSTIERTFKITLRLEQILNAPTIAGLSTAIEEGLVARVEALSDEESRRLLEDA
ncbi:MAG: phosphopantetheine-binding protein, partial [Vicinamibacterales bacterium]